MLMEPPRMRISATVLDAPDPPELGAFYARLLGWTVTESDATWTMVRPPDGGTGLSFQFEPVYVPPVWPGVPDEQLMMSHLDIAVDDLEAAVAWALKAGAKPADHQPQEHVRVMLDPAGHPFCLFQGEV
jgi:catechol 2,3-dioxygenase-like lactoylglutathione lyase family enzyme